MNDYAMLNTGLAVLTFTVAIIVTDKRTWYRDSLVALRVSCLLAFITFPWDFLANKLELWTYGSSVGPKFLSVPVNDLVLAWLCTYLTCCLLIATSRRKTNGEGQAKRESTSQQDIQ